MELASVQAEVLGFISVGHDGGDCGAIFIIMLGEDMDDSVSSHLASGVLFPIAAR